MGELLHRATRILVEAGPWIGPALAGGTFAESLVVVGVFVPITPLLVGSGAAMGAGLVGPSLLPWVMLGAFLGGWASYELGRTLRERGARPPRLPGKVQALAESLFLQHGALAVIVARFTGPPTVLPFLCGWWALPRRRFLLANAGACLAWPPAVMALGALGAWVVKRVG